jgi:hypothetical protein
MEPRHSWEAASFEVTQEFHNILWNPKVHYRVHKSPPLVPILSQINKVHTASSYLRPILILSTRLCQGIPSGVFPFGFPNKNLYTFLSFSIRTKYPAHHILWRAGVSDEDERTVWVFY